MVLDSSNAEASDHVKGEMGVQTHDRRAEEANY
jgi:hypothetical protein